ncbi:MAG: peptide chain release factor 1 [Alphaproteobacteria bacterium]|nr:peptide chain release factor 1 [Alphaproteobacteria bacterium]
MYDRLEALRIRLDVLDRMLSDPDVVSDNRRLRETSQEAAHVREIVEAYDAHKAMQAELEGARELATVEQDAELRALAREEIAALEAALAESHEALKLLLLPKDPYEGRPLLLEIRAGTGGDEAALFAADLFRMYQRYGDRHGLKVSVLEASPIVVGSGGKSHEGFKEIVASVNGQQAYNLLRFEGGVHRVQRVPATEAQGRIHTSAATVAVLPEPDEVEVKIDAKDLRIDTMRAGGPGGQSVNTTDSAVRIVHLPTGLTVQCQDEKSQLKNKDKAMRVLKARLLAMEEEKAAAAGNAARRAMVGSGDRSERIRTYNFPQNRITDHRIGLTLYKLDHVIEGDLDDLQEALLAAYRAQLLEGEGSS